MLAGPITAIISNGNQFLSFCKNWKKKKLPSGGDPVAYIMSSGFGEKYSRQKRQVLKRCFVKLCHPMISHRWTYMQVSKTKTPNFIQHISKGIADITLLVHTIERCSKCISVMYAHIQFCFCNKKTLTMFFYIQLLIFLVSAWTKFLF